MGAAENSTLSIKGSAQRASEHVAAAGRAEVTANERSLAALSAVADAIDRLRYGAVHLTIHDGRVVQLDVTERQRFT